jgi:hypothetical protein
MRGERTGNAQATIRPGTPPGAAGIDTSPHRLLRGFATNGSGFRPQIEILVEEFLGSENLKVDPQSDDFVLLDYPVS